MTIHRRTRLLLAGIAGTLLIASVFVVSALLNADRYRPKAISYLEVSTGKKVEIGRLAVTLFPRLTIDVDTFGVKNPPLFTRGWRPWSRGRSSPPAGSGAEPSVPWRCRRNRA
jgi:hypothetical protein